MEDSRPHERLSHIFMHPSFWMPSVTCDFLEKSAQFLKNTSNKPGDAGKPYREFPHDINNEARNLDVLGGRGDWKHAISPEHYKVIFKNCNKEGNSSLAAKCHLITNLIKVCRNMREHFRDLAKDDKKILGWTSKETTEEFWAKYWTKLYPKMIPFLWVKFYKFRNESTLVPFYSGFLADITSIPLVEPKDLLRNLDDAITDNIFSGGLHECLVSSDQNLEIRIHIIPAVEMAHVLSKSSSTILVIQISDSGVVLLSKGGKLTKYSCPDNFGDKSLKHYTLVISNDPAGFDGFMLGHCKDSKKIAIFTNLDYFEKKREKLYVKLTSTFGVSLVTKPISWHMLKLISQSRARDLLKRQIKIQGCQTSLREILLPQKDGRKAVLAKLNGEVLQKLLRNEPPILFANCKRASAGPMYISRQTVKLIEIGSEVISSVLLSSTDSFLVMDAYENQVRRLINDSKKITIYKCNDFHQGYLLKGYLSFSNIKLTEILKNCTKAFASEDEQSKVSLSNVHLLQYENDTTAVYCGTSGNKSTLESCLKTSLDDYIFGKESELVDALPETNQSVIIIGQPGMGKSFFLQKFADILYDRTKPAVVAPLEIGTFVQKIGDFSSNKESVERALLNLICETELEIELAKYWLNQEGCPFIRIEVLFDGLDEFKSEARNIFLNILKTIQIALPSVRVWVTMQNHLQKHFANDVLATRIRLSPFSKEEQIEYLSDRWLHYAIENEKVTQDVASIIDFNDFAQKCLDAQMLHQNLAGVPLQCFLITEVFAEQAVNTALNSNTNSNEQEISNLTLAMLYERVLEEKFKIYLRRNGCSHEKMNKYFLTKTRNDMLIMHFYFALRLIISDAVAVWYKNKLHLNIPNDLDFAENIMAFGIIQDFEQSVFIHRTYAEFLVAFFLFQVLCDQNHIGISKTDNEFENLLWSEILQPRNSGSFLSFKYQAIAEFLDELLNDNINYQTGCKANAGDLIFEVSSVKWFRDDNRKIFADGETAGIENIYEIFLKHNFPYKNIFQLAIICRSGLSQMVLEYFYDCGICWEFAPLFRMSDCKTTCPILNWIASSLCKTDRKFVVRPSQNMKTYLDRKVFSNTELENFLLLLIEYANILDAVVVDWIKYFFAKHAFNLKFSDKDGNNFLHALCKSDSYRYFITQDNMSAFLELFRFLVKGFCNPVAAKNYGETPFHILVQTTNIVTLEVLKEYNEYVKNVVNQQRKNGDNLLLVALKSSHCTLDVIEVLIDLGADLNQANNFRETSFLKATEKGRIDILEIFLLEDVNILHVDKENNNVLFYACRSSNVNVMKQLLEVNLEFSLVGKNGMNVLQSAIQHTKISSKELIEFLATRFPELIHSVDKDGQTIWHYAAKHTDYATFNKVFCYNKASVHVLDKFGNSPLHTLVNSCRHVDIKEKLLLLLQNGGEIYQINRCNQCVVYTALKYNINRSNCAIISTVMSLEKEYAKKQCKCKLHSYIKHNSLSLEREWKTFLDKQKTVKCLL